ncbi:MAG TPA: hypothetical protein VJ463_03935 [Geothrix sp.]|nr:hypothetical protein [Geothrix sp.]
MAGTPFYLDWKFWSFVTSFFAIILSQVSPIRVWFRKAKLEIEAYSRVMINHKVGNPNVQLHLILTNVGGRLIKVRSIVLSMKRGEEITFTVPAQNFFQLPTDKESVLMTPFKLKPGEDWGHIISFFNHFSRAEDKEYRQLESNLRSDIYAKRAVLTDKEVDVPADQKYVDPLVSFFNKKFCWEPGEYEIELQIEAEPVSASTRSKFRFTLFESDTQELREIQKGYAYGAGIYYEPPRVTGLFLPLTKS